MFPRSLLILIVPFHSALGQQTEVRFANVPCHLAFAYPSAWEVVRDTDAMTPCDFQIRPKDWQQRLVADDSVDLRLE